MGEPTVNGEVPSSLFFSHLSSYPVVSQSIDTFKSYPYGQYSLDIADQGYNSYAKPLLSYFKPLGPYLSKVDSLGNEGLNRVDGRFPIVKQKPDAIRGTVVTYIKTPVRLADDQKKHLLDLYSSQYKRTGGSGYVASGKAIVSTGLMATSEGLEWLSSYIVPSTRQNGRPSQAPAQQNGQTPQKQK